LSCQVTNTAVTVDIQRLTLSGLPDGNTIARGTFTNVNTFTSVTAVSTSPPIDFAIDAKFAFVISTSNACSLTSTQTGDVYNGGDAYVNAGGGWVPMITTDSRYDVPSFITLIQPAMSVPYLNSNHSNHIA